MVNSVEPVDIGVYIPPEILHLRLTERQKIVLAAIVQLYRGNRECYASNGYFGRWRDDTNRIVLKGLFWMQIEEKCVTTVVPKGKV